MYVAKPGYLSRILSLRVPLTASAQVANREQGVKVTDADGKSFYEVIVEGATAASTFCGVSVTANPSWAKRSNANAVVVPMPDLYLPAEYRLEGVIPGLQTEDLFGVGFALVEQFEPEQHRPYAELGIEVARLRETLEALRYAAG